MGEWGQRTSPTNCALLSGQGPGEGSGKDERPLADVQQEKLGKRSLLRMMRHACGWFWIPV